MSEAIVIAPVASIACDANLGAFELNAQGRQRVERALDKAERLLRKRLAGPPVTELFSVQSQPSQSLHFPERKTPIRLGDLTPVDIRKSYTNARRRSQFWMGMVLARWAVPGYTMSAPSAVGAQLQMINLLCKRVDIHQGGWCVKAHMTMGAGRRVFHYVEVISESESVTCMDELGRAGWETKAFELNRGPDHQVASGDVPKTPGIWGWLFEDPPYERGSSVLLVRRGS